MSKSCLPISNLVKELFCSNCIVGKCARLPFHASVCTTSRPLELIYADVWGQTPLASVSGYKFYVIFVDDFTKYTWLYPLKYKSDVFQTFVKFQALVENVWISNWYLHIRLRWWISHQCFQTASIHSWHSTSYELPSHSPNKMAELRRSTCMWLRQQELFSLLLMYLINFEQRLFSLQSLWSIHCLQHLNHHHGSNFSRKPPIILYLDPLAIYVIPGWNLTLTPNWNPKVNPMSLLVIVWITKAISV